MAQRTRWLVLDKGVPSPGSYWFSSTSVDGAFLGTLATETINEFSRSPYPSMSVAFNGTELVLLGRINNGSKGEVPRWACTLDGTPMNIQMLPEQGHFSCSWKGTANSAHNFTVGFIDTTPGSLSVDSIWYLPTYDSVRPKDAYVVYRHNDIDISRSGNWTTLDHGGSNATLTSDKGATLTLTFTGSVAIAEGWSPSNFPAGVSKCAYTVTPGSSFRSEFQVEPPDPPSETIHNIQLFETLESKSVGELKNLTITYNGPNAPLAIERFFVKDGNFRIGDNPAAPAPSGGTSGGSSEGDGFKTIGDILKIAVPTVVGFFILCFVLGCFTGCWSTFTSCCKRRNRPNDAVMGYDGGDTELTDQSSYTPSQQMPVYFPHNESGHNLMQGDQFYQPYQQQQPPPPLPYQHPGLNQSVSGMYVGGGIANITGRDTTHITVNNYNVPPEPLNPRNAL